MSTPLPLVDLEPETTAVSEECLAAVLRVVRSQKFILGEEVSLFEQELARFVGVRYAVGVASGTDALVLALMAAGVGDGHLVITSPFTFVATAEAIMRAGALPFFCDVDLNTCNIHTNDVAEALARCERTPLGLREPQSGRIVKAVLPVHLFGRCADMTALLSLAHDHGLEVIEDAAQAMGATHAEGRAGAMGRAGCFSFFPTKNLGAWGDAGAVTTDDENVAKMVRSLRQHGLDGGAHRRLGCNSRLDALQAAVLRVKLRHVKTWNEERRALARRYRELLAPCEGVTVPPDEPGHVYQTYAVRLRDRVTRDRVRRAFEARAIGCRAYYEVPLHEETPFAEAPRRPHLPMTHEVASTLLALPFHVGLSVEVQTRVASVLAETVARTSV